MTRYILVSILFAFFCKCNTIEEDKNQWNNIKDSRDFSSFFNFALEASDSLLLNNCYDSLDKYKPMKRCIILTNYKNISDSLNGEEFLLEDQCGFNINYKNRNILFVNINERDSVEAEYNYLLLSNYSKTLINLLDTDSTSYELPQLAEIEIEGEKYKQRKFGVMIFCEMLPDTMLLKTSWRSLTNVTNKVLTTFDEVKTNKAIKIFNKSYENLTELESSIIDEIVPKIINIHFYGNRKPPPPLSKRKLEKNKVSIKKDTGANKRS